MAKNIPSSNVKPRANTQSPPTTDRRTAEYLTAHRDHAEAIFGRFESVSSCMIVLAVELRTSLRTLLQASLEAANDKAQTQTLNRVNEKTLALTTGQSLLREYPETQ